MNTSEAVRRGSEIMETAEEMSGRLKGMAKEMRAVMEAVRDDGHIGVVECEAMWRDFDAIARRLDADLYVYHSKAILRCRAMGIDLPQRDGGR